MSPDGFMKDAANQMVQQPFCRESQRDGRDGASYRPDIMVSLILYSYCMSERWSHRIEGLCEHNMRYRVIAVNCFPDDSTISRFRQGRENEEDKPERIGMKHVAVAAGRRAGFQSR